MSKPTPRGIHGRWFTRDFDDPIDPQYDRSPAAAGGVDLAQATDPVAPPPTDPPE
jgi:hypothetical protein